MKLLKCSIRTTTASLFLLTAVTLVCLVPFIGKAFHIDDPLFIWCAQQVQHHPCNFFGFEVNWEGRVAPMATITQNPPLAAYYLALIGSLLGWSEVALHAGFLLPALAVVLGTYYLARTFCSHPVWTALVVGASPVFILSSTNVMCDTSMLAFWVWALFFWIEGLKREKRTMLCLAALFIAAASLTKYFGLSLVPLLMIYSALERRKIGLWLVCLLLSLLPLAFYQWLTYRLYGHGLLVNAVAYATGLRVGGGLPSKLLSGFAFVGGCIVVLLTAAPNLWGIRRLLAALPVVLLIGGLIVRWQKVGVFSVMEAGAVKWLSVAQMSVYVVGGASLLILTGADVLKHRTPASILLALWITGTLLFTCAMNWTVSGRNILPMLPAVSLLVVRRLEARGTFVAESGMRCLLVSLAISLALALLVAAADFRLANASRVAASFLTRKLATTASATRFEGHWGFQYYMEQHGAVALDRLNPQLSPNEAVVIPLGNSYLFPLPTDRVELWFRCELNASKWLTTMNRFCGAGFYSDGWGPLPFVFCTVPPEQYLVYRVK